MAENGSGNRSAQDWYNQGRHLTLTGRYADAVRAYSRAIELDVEFARAYFGRGACRYATSCHVAGCSHLAAETHPSCRIPIFCMTRPDAGFRVK